METTMGNYNPTLALGAALDYTRRQGTELQLGDERDAELRVYAPEGTGYWFVRASSAGRWYEIDANGADHFRRADETALRAAIDGGARVQLCGYHSRPLTLWPTWSTFAQTVGL